MTAEEQAKAYYDNILEQNPPAQAWRLDVAWLAGYNAAQREFVEFMKSKHLI